MRLEKKREEELANRKGLAGKTIIQTIWLILSFGVAYYLVDLLFDQGVISHNMVYGIGIPRAVPEWAITLTFMFIIVVAMQFFLFFGYAIASPEGRRRTGDPTLQSRTKDPYDYGQQ